MSASEYLDLYPYVNGSQWARYEQTGNSGEHTQVDYSEIIYSRGNRGPCGVGDMVGRSISEGLCTLK